MSMGYWVYADTIARIKDEKLRVLEHNPETGEYRERVYTARDMADEVRGVVYE